ncbi:feruloyl-CoA synthase [Pusillimonas sp. NJUB218]|uniref:feruloyl-CoA synthase n=1 Tax=Pusillimonas sp. NJUB218 TaxID=2023230 RepID=UPI000F4B490C|nr:feruloyl-CoA synthase [Pusillimonas sp. NJUB218]ROT45652.1 hypothetical protein CHR62_05165 [Pusillimonas sp. NJUB218]
MSTDTFCAVAAVRQVLPDGSFILRNAHPLQPYGRCITDALLYWAERTPDETLLAQRAGNLDAPEAGWERQSYAQTLARARAVGQYLINAGCGPHAPLAVVAENSIDTANILLGALYAGVPVAPVSPAYASVDAAFDKLLACFAALKPAVIYTDNLSRYGAALLKACTEDVIVIAPGAPTGAVALDEVLATPADSVDVRNASIAPDDVAKILFTSGSTGVPKGVINTQRMLCANQQQLAQIFPFVQQRKPVLVDWLPWHHTFGGNEVFFLALSHGGTLYIDAGKPAGALFERTVSNLREVSPTIHFNVPLAFHQLVNRMTHDDVLCQSFFNRLDLIFYAGAGMPQKTWSDLEDLAAKVRGHRVPLVTAWGATETAPLATGVFFDSRRADNIGLPVPGCDIKFARVDDRYELRVKGPNVFPGYLARPDLTSSVFDDEGYFRSGDAARLVDDADPAQGIVFEGRIAEDFKLQSGTWVSVGRLRGLLLGELLPVVADVVIAGSGRTDVRALVFIDLAAARRLVGDATLNYEALAQHVDVASFVQAGVSRYNQRNPGSAMYIAAYVLATQPPSAQAREITDKGSLNQANVLANRAQAVEALYAD